MLRPTHVRPSTGEGIGMGDPAQSVTSIVSLPKGGGAIRGIGETFRTDPESGTGSSSVPIQIPAGRGGFQPTLALNYSSGNGNGLFGLGWDLTVPGIARKTARGAPTYNDDDDTLILSGAEDSVALGLTANGGVSYRPRTESR